MPIIYIKNLVHNEVEVCRALFDAAAKTEEGMKAKKYGIQMTADMPGLWSPLLDYEIEADLQTAKKQRNGRMREVGYLTVNLIFQLNTENALDVTEYEKTYGISAKEVLAKVGFTCSNDPISTVKSTSMYSSFLVQETKSEKPTRASVVNHSFFSLKNIDTDKRFIKSTKPGILYEASSYGRIDDETLKSYGFVEGQWERHTQGIDHIVIIKKLNDNIAPALSNIQSGM
ncbi:hypothetical protein [Legionella cincinnatiensis]|uniref:Uncharacterized protein n=1 Tax=Legionella cincinnatiensis TaxID=28085 RepID=A0A378IHN5_9GAMM|nr:hypothetical protein [Legionella cincinnatiensis]KTC83525.1 hypothetical protein Lcin_2212 [Legionella cincinnatiensis]STX34516.1 Uncharacterised protein [Legionella cincinnatiensis]